MPQVEVVANACRHCNDKSWAAWSAAACVLENSQAERILADAYQFGREKYGEKNPDQQNVSE
jgi:hypothetical protein